MTTMEWYTEEPEVATDNRTTLWCVSCRTLLGPYQQFKLTRKSEKVECRGCGRPVYDVLNNQMDTLIRTDAQRMLTNPPEFWWHGTNDVRANLWRNGTLPADAFVHVGTYAAARQRVRDLPVASLFKVRLLPGVRFSETIWKDYSAWPMVVGDGYFGDFEEKMAYRYINRYESPGSLSLFLTFDSLVVVDSVCYSRVGSRYVKIGKG